MIYDINRTVEYVEFNYRKIQGRELINQALKVGISNLDNFFNIFIKESERIEQIDYCDKIIWDKVLPFAPDNKTLFKMGDLICEEGNCYFVLSNPVVDSNKEIFEFNAFETRSNDIIVKIINKEKIRKRLSVIRISDINELHIIYYSLIFKYLFTNQDEYFQFVFDCWPNHKIFDDDDFYSFSNELDKENIQVFSEEIIHSLMQKNNGYLEYIRKYLLWKDVNEIYTKKGNLNTKNLNTTNTIRNIQKITKSKEIGDKLSRRIFQERFTGLFQIYLMLCIVGNRNNNLHKPIKEVLKYEPIVNYSGVNGSVIKEGITLKNVIWDKIRSILKVLTLNDDVNVNSIYSLAGYVFDSFSGNPTSIRESNLEEYRRFSELVDCYGRGNIDYYFALERFKDTNHYAAEELSAIYYYGETYGEYKVEPDREKSIQLLNTCQDYSVSARWSLAENYKNYANRLKSEKERNKYNKLAIYYYKNCGNYPPALNSLANIYINTAKRNKSKLYYKKAFDYAIRSAQFGWIYALNNLYVFFTDTRLIVLLDESQKREIENKAYKIFNLNGKNYMSSKEDNRIRNEEEFRMLIGEIKEGKKLSFLNNKKDLLLEFIKNEDGEIARNPLNFLIVSACCRNTYALNHLGIEYLSIDRDKARECFEYTAQYETRGLYNLAIYIYSDDIKEKIKYLYMAMRQGDEQAKEELKRLQQGNEQVIEEIKQKNFYITN